MDHESIKSSDIFRIASMAILSLMLIACDDSPEIPNNIKTDLIESESRFMPYQKCRLYAKEVDKTIPHDGIVEYDSQKAYPGFLISWSNLSDGGAISMHCVGNYLTVNIYEPDEALTPKSYSSTTPAERTTTVLKHNNTTLDEQEKSITSFEGDFTLIEEDTTPMNYRECKSNAQIVNGETNYEGKVVLDDPNPTGKVIGYLIKWQGIFSDTGEMSIQCIHGNQIIRHYEPTP